MPRRPGQRPRFPVLPAIWIAIGTALFVWLAVEMTAGSTIAFDRRWLLAMRTPHPLTDPVASPNFAVFARDITALGGATMLGIWTIGLALWWFLKERRREAVALLSAVASAFLVNILLKQGFARPRPDLVEHGATVTSASFPSGHAMVSTVAYVTIATTIARTEKRIGPRCYVLFGVLLLIAAIGVSRVYLGVHWPSDVVAGWLAGSVWAAVSHTAQVSMQRRSAHQRSLS